jgi:hypothetical protein
MNPVNRILVATQKFLLRGLTFARVVDAHDGLLSLTNIALIVGITRLAVFVDAGTPELVSLLLGLVAYEAKRRRGGVAKDTASLVDAAKDAVSKVAALEPRVSAWESKLQALGDTLRLGGKR